MIRSGEEREELVCQDVEVHVLMSSCGDGKGGRAGETPALRGGEVA
jgi:hypothetical protein